MNGLVNYHDFNRPENETGLEPVDIGVGDETTKDGEQESRSHEICESVGRRRHIETQPVREIYDQAHHVGNKPHVLQCQQSYTHIYMIK